MEQLKKYVIPSVLILGSLAAMFLFREIPATKLWKGYSVLYVPAGSDYAAVCGALDKSGCAQYISLKNQYFPIAALADSPEVSLAMSGLETSPYLSARNAYFFDRSGRFEIFYIPDSCGKNAAAAAAVSLNEECGISAGVGMNAAYPWIVPLVCLLFAAALAFFSADRRLAAAALVCPALFSFSMPFYSAGAAACLFMYGVFLAVRLWGRRGAAAFLSRNVFSVPFFVSPLLLLLLTGLRCALVFLSVCAAVLAAFVLMAALEEREDRRCSFVPVKIRSARMVPLLNGRARLCMALCAAAVLLISLRIASGITSVPSVGGVQLPSAGGGGGDFPNMNDFISWKWEVMTFPYRSVNGSVRRGAPANGETVSFPRYADVGGRIEESVQSISFDSEFRREALDAVDSLQYPAIEKLLKAQGLSLRAGYASTGVQRVTVLTVVLLSVSFLIPSVLSVVAARRR